MLDVEPMRTGERGDGCFFQAAQVDHQIAGDDGPGRDERHVGVGLRRAGKTETAKAQLARVESHDPPENRRLQPQQQMKRHVRLQPPQHRDRGAEHTHRGTGAAFGRDIGKHRAIARTAAAEGADIAGKADHRCTDQRLAGGMAGIAQDIGRGKAVGCVDDQIGLPDQFRDVLRRQPLDDGIDRDRRVELQKGRARAVRLGLADVGHAVERLAMQVRLLDHVVIDDDQSADSCTGKILQYRTAEAARADDQHRRGRQTRLSRDADLAQHGLAGIAIAHETARVSAIHF